MPEFSVTITINTTATAKSKEAIVEDLKRLEAKKDELSAIVQRWLNERP